MEIIISKPLEQIVREKFSGNAKLTRYWKNTGAILTSFSKSIGTTKDRITVIDLFDENLANNLSQRFVKFVNNTTHTNKYKSQLKVGVRSLVNAVCELHQKKSDTASEPIIPEFFKPVLQFLPRKACHLNYDSPERLSYPLTGGGQKIYSTCLCLIDEYKIKDINSLFIDHRILLSEKLRRDYPGYELEGLKEILSYVLKKLGYGITKSKDNKKSISLKDFPAKLRVQVEVFIEKAPFGLEAEAEISVEATKKGINIKPLEAETTVKTYVTALEVAIGQIKFEDYDNVSIETLLRIQYEEQLDETGNKLGRPYNPYVDEYREIERLKPSEYKRKGFDSRQFATFLNALKAVAAFNKIFCYHERFRQAYSAQVDNQNLKDRKQNKKAVFSIKWIDSEIARLIIKFREIIKNRSFKDERNKRNFYEYKENLQFCFFFVQLVAMRYNGFRQQLLRNCEIGRNIIFSSDNSITLYWDEALVKNDRSYSNFLSPKRHGRTSGLLIEVLNTYYKHVYPYIKANAKNDLENQFFVRFANHGIVRYDANNAVVFSGIFKRYILKFLEYEDLLKQIPVRLHPQFFRGLCGDWLHENGTPLPEIAIILGDREETVRNEYLDPTKGYDARFAFDKVNENLRREEHMEAEDNNISNGLAEEFKKLNKRFDEQNTLIEKLYKRIDEKDEIIRILTEKLQTA